MMGSLAGIPPAQVRSPGQQWTEMEQHKQVCFSLDGMAGDYHTLLIETDRSLSLANIFGPFEKPFGSTSGFMHQLSFQSAS